MDLSEVPLLVLEKVRNKWWDIAQPGDLRIHQPCAMCGLIWQEMLTGFWFGRCREYCPICADCDRVTSIRDPNWPDHRDDFLEKIIAEIDRRSTCE